MDGSEQLSKTQGKLNKYNLLNIYNLISIDMYITQIDRQKSEYRDRSIDKWVDR